MTDERLKQLMLIQLPNDSATAGYVKTRPFHWEQVFSSQSANFTGTEKQFLNAGKAYGYIQVGPFKRLVIAGPPALSSKATLKDEPVEIAALPK